MVRRQLILVDLDNVMVARTNRRGPHWLWQGPSSYSVIEQTEGPDCVVAIAVNLITILRFNLSFADIDSLSLAFGHHLGSARTIRTELALVWSSPQAADNALERLCGRSPFPFREAFDEVCLASHDGTLRRSIAKSLGVDLDWNRRSDLIQSWSLAKPHSRKPSSSETLRGSPELPSGDAVNVRIHNKALAIWAREQDLEVDVSTDLVEIAGRTRDNPGLLTQIGAGELLRGVAWLAGLRRGHRKVGDCQQNDQLILRCQPLSRSLCAGPFSKVTLDPAMVWAANGPALLYCLFPSALVKECVRNETVDVWRGKSIDTRSVYRTIKLNEPVRTLEVAVRFTRGYRGALHVSLISMEHPRVWWVWDNKMKTDVELGSFDLLPRGAIENIPCWPIFIPEPPPPGRQLAFRAAVHDVAKVEVSEQIPGSTLGSARAGDRDCVLLAPQQGLGTGFHACVTIQEIDEHDFQKTNPDLLHILVDLKRLPILVFRADGANAPVRAGA